MANLLKGAIPALAAALTALAAPALAQGPEVRPDAPRPVIIQPDPREFRNSCASCHGIDGKGAGFLTKLFRGVDPGDLTTLSLRNGGPFPLEQVFSVIDGRAEIAAHGDRKMPVWGDRYMVDALTEYGPDELNEYRVRNRIYELVHYLQSIQLTDS